LQNRGAETLRDFLPMDFKCTNRLIPAKKLPEAEKKIGVVSIVGIAIFVSVIDRTFFLGIQF